MQTTLRKLANEVSSTAKNDSILRPLILLALASQSARAAVTFRENYETGGLNNQSYLSCELNGPPCTTPGVRAVTAASGSIDGIAAPPPRSGSWMLRAYAKGADSGIGTHKRAEVHNFRAGDTAQGVCMAGREYWYGFSSHIPTTWADNDGWTIISQWHAPSGDVMQPLQIEVTGDSYWITNYVGPGGAYIANSLWNKNIDHPAEASAEIARDKGRWIDWVINAKWSGGGDGFIRIWKNGVLIVHRTGANIYCSGATCYAPDWKIGLAYNNARTDSKLVFYDDIKQGDGAESYDTIKPGAAGRAADTAPPTAPGAD